MKYVRWFDSLTMKDVGLVGGKNASLGEMISGLSKQGVTIPDGFAITSKAYWYYIEYNDLLDDMQTQIKRVDPKKISTVQSAGKAIRAMLSKGQLPEDLAKEIVDAYAKLSKKYHAKQCDVAVRSSATAEDLPTASFAGQQETFLNVKGPNALLRAVKKSIASLFTDRAIIYRIEKGFDHFQVALSTGVQKMIRSDKASSGVAFSLDTETGFKDVIMIDASWGLGETIVKGMVNPDEYTVFTSKLQSAKDPIINKRCGSKKKQMVYTSSSSHPTKLIAVPAKKQHQFCLSDKEIISLATMVHTIEQYYTRLKKKWSPMDVEWAKDGIDGKLYIVQARPETVHSHETRTEYMSYELKNGLAKKHPISSGQSIGSQIVSGTARVISSIKQASKIQQGDIIVTSMTDPDWVPIMKKAGGIITDLGGRTCHAAIVSRELGIPAIVGTQNASKKIKSGQMITLDCSQGQEGFIYSGALSYNTKKIALNKVPKLPVKLMVNIGDPSNAYRTSMLPVDGVGLARMEFIIANNIKVHPMALLEPSKVVKASEKKEIERLVAPFASKKQYFIDTLAYGIGTIAAAFYPRPVIVRLSDFKTNEYRSLIAGHYFEQEEANPMLGFRGASRYNHDLYRAAFKLECDALKKVRNEMGLDNVQIMVPFVRTVAEGNDTLKLLAKNGIIPGKNKLKMVMMCELPSNVLMIDEFAQIFDAFSIGSNDLAQLTLGVDRDSALLSAQYTEQDDAVKRMIKLAITGAHKAKRQIGICGQAPSDYPEFAQFLITQKIDSISLNPDSVLPFLIGYKSKQ